MTFSQALVYFAREAALNLLRGWRVSLLAILTIAMSLFLGGLFLLVSGNLQGVVEQWQGESKVVLYFADDAEAADQKRLYERLDAAEWTTDVRAVSPEEAEARFRESFPSLGDLLEGWGDQPLPASLEAGFDQETLAREQIDAQLADLRADPAVSMVDDDRDWLRQLETVVLVLEGFGLLVGAVLLLTAIFTISSVIRLTAYLYRDEIAVMRMVGATEFFIRGPFYMEGFFQGLAGGLTALAGLFAAHEAMVRRGAESLLAAVLTEDFLPPRHLIALVALGGIAGLVGAIFSLHRENFAQSEDELTDEQPVS